MKPIKAVIPVAGLGTRMLPATKAVPKEMLPLVDKPLIQFIIDECIASGIKDIVLVTHSSKAAIRKHFEKNSELKSNLEHKDKSSLVALLDSILPNDVTISFVEQEEAKGLGHAISIARPLIGESPFVVILSDVLLNIAESNLTTQNLASMLKQFQKNQVSQIMVEPVSKEDVSNYGIVDCGNVEIESGQSAKMTKIVEKPSVEDAPSNLAVVGRYVLSSKIWSTLENTPKGVGGEIQLTDAISSLIEQETVEAFHLIGKSYDCGSKLGYMKAFVEYGNQHSESGNEFSSFLTSFVKKSS